MLSELGFLIPINGGIKILQKQNIGELWYKTAVTEPVKLKSCNFFKWNINTIAKLYVFRTKLPVS